MKGKLCKHTIGMHFRNKTDKIPLTDTVRSLPLHQKRKRGRPNERRNVHCLSKSPVREISSDIYEVEDMNSEELFTVAAKICSICAEDGKKY